MLVVINGEEFADQTIPKAIRSKITPSLSFGSLLMLGDHSGHIHNEDGQVLPVVWNEIKRSSDAIEINLQILPPKK